jgi:VCBS repeat-containing protein
VATFNGGGGNDHINGTNGNDTINGNAGNDDLDGRGGNDTINGGTGDDTIDGGTGNDIIHGDADNDTIDGGDGNDTIYGDDGNDVLDGGTGMDSISGGSGNDILIGGDGNDTLTGGGGYDLIYGGAGTDTAVYSGSVLDYDFYRLGFLLGVVHSRGTGADGADLLLSIEKLQFSDVTIDLTQNNAPIAQNDTAATNEDAGTYSSGSASVLDNDFDFEGDTLTVAPGSFSGTFGTLTLNANGTYSYVLNANAQTLAQGQTGQDIFTYTVSDGSLSDTATLTITIAGVNDAPVANNDSASGTENQILTIDVLVNDTDVDNGHVLTVVSASAPVGKGSASVVSNQVQFNPGADFDHLAQGATETVVLSYTITDEHGATASAAINVLVTGTNDAPVAVADIASGTENQILTIDVLVNDTDVDDGHTLTVVSASAPAGQGSASVVGNQVRFDPGTDFDHLAQGATQIVVVNYSIQDEHGASSSSTVTITVTGTNDGPVAVADTAAGTENQILLIDVLANDTDVDDGHILSVTAASAPAGQGSASVVGNQVQFDPGADFDHLAQGATQIVVVNYSIQDEHGASSSSTVTITVTGTNDAPVAHADTASGTENQTLLVDVLVNDTDVDDGHSLTVTAASAPAGQGSASVVGNQVQFNPGTDFDHLAVGETATVVVNYSIQDDHGASSSSTLTITVTGTNDAPTINAGGTDASGSVTELPNNAPGENVTVHQDSGTVAFNDVDTSDVHSATATPQGGSYLGTFTLDPVNQAGDTVAWHFSVSDAALDSLNAGDTLTQIYTVQIDDGHGGTANQDVTITIHGAADANGPPWYIDNSAVGSANNGSAGNPYTSIAAFNAAQGTVGGPAVGDTVYLLAGTGTYAEADGINLLNNQILIGVPAGAVRPTIVTTAGDGINVAQGNDVSHIDIGSTSGAGIADSGGTVGTLNVTDVGKAGAGQIADIDQGGTIHVTLNGASSTSSSGGAIDLNGLSGDFTVTGATNIAGAAGGGVDVTAGVNFVTTFQGGLAASTGSTTAVNFSGNAGSSALAIAGGLALTTTTGAGLQVQNGGTVTVTGSTNTIATTGGSAVVISHSTIGGAGVTLQSASSLGGSADGIILDTAGAGGFTITGTGSVAGSGGTIANKTGANGLTLQGNGVYINATSNVSLDNMAITGNANHGILGSGVTNFTLIDSALSNNGNSAAEGGVVFNGLFGTASLLGNVIGGSAGDNVRVNNVAGSLNLTIADSGSDQAIIGSTNNVTGNDGIFVQTSGSASLTLLVDGVDFQGARADLLNTNATGSSTQNITIQNNVFNNLQASSVGGGLLIAGTAGTNINVDYKVINNDFTGAVGSAINAAFATKAGLIHGYINGNSIGLANGVAGSQGSTGGDGISVSVEKLPGVGTASHYVIISNNDVHDIAQGNGGISLSSRGGGSGNAATLEAIVHDNVINELGSNALAGLYAQVGGTGGGDFSKLGLALDNNVIDAGGALLSAVYLDQISTDAHFYFPGYAGSPDGEYFGGTASADLDAYLAARGNVMTNGDFPSFPGGVDAGGATGVTGDPVQLPWFP